MCSRTCQATKSASAAGAIPFQIARTPCPASATLSLPSMNLDAVQLYAPADIDVDASRVWDCSGRQCSHGPTNVLRLPPAPHGHAAGLDQGVVAFGRSARHLCSDDARPDFKDRDTVLCEPRGEELRHHRDAGLAHAVIGPVLADDLGVRRANEDDTGSRAWHCTGKTATRKRLC